MSERKTKKYLFESKSWNLCRGMSLYKRKDSPRFYGCLRINGKYYRKCLNTENKNEGEELLFQWKNELLSDLDSPVSEENQTFRYFSKKLIEKEKTYQPTPSGYELHESTEKTLNRENGLLEHFGGTDVLNINEEDIYSSLKKVIPTQPCWIVIHSSLLKFDFEGQKSPKWAFIKAIKRLADEGYTLAFPSFTFSFTATGEFDPVSSPSETGILADWIFQLNQSVRTKHPIYSHILIGPNSIEGLSGSTETCFGKGSIFSIFDKKDACLVMFGCGWEFCTSFHYFEEIHKVPYRYYKKFYYLDEKKEYTEMFVRDLKKKPKNDFLPSIKILRENSSIISHNFLGGTIESTTFSDLSITCNKLLEEDKYAFLENSRQIRKLVNEEEEARKLSINVAILGDSNLVVLRNKFKDFSEKLIPGCTINHFSSDFGQIYSDLAANKLKKLKLDYSFLPNRLEDIFQVASVDLIDLKNLEPLHRYLNFICEIGKLNSRKVFINEFFIGNEQIHGPLYVEKFQSAKEFVRNANTFLHNEVNKHPNIYVMSPEVMTGGSLESDLRLWYLGRIPFSNEITRKMAYSYCSFIANDLGKTARLIILDLDNTLWGGVLSEDGIKGIKIGGDFPGNAYKDFQSTILKLKERGIALAVVSKNEEDLALRALKNHPEILIKESDLASYRINWNEKYQNIIDICSDLSLGLNNVLFVDDNPIEREKVKVNLPEVNVLDLPEDPSLYRKSLLEHVSLGLSIFTSEDLKRADSYLKLKELKRTRSSFKNINDFYQNLKIKVFIQEINDGNFARTLQLINKTNQFNTTTLRYDDKKVIQIHDSLNDVIKVIGYEDKMTDFENIGVFILKKVEKELHIENFLLSCRVLDRGIEQAALNWIFNYAKDEGINSLIGDIIKTPRNTPAQNFYKVNKFMYDDHALNWISNLNHKIKVPSWIELIESR